VIRQNWPAILIGLKLLLAMACGGAIGFERELSRKAAGLRTNALICFGAALYMILSRQISGGAAFTDPARLAAQVVAGIGFLGAGVILQSRGSVTGLTTAATIFVVGAVGIAIGENKFSLAIFSTALVIIVLVVLRTVEREIIKRKRLFHYRLTTGEPAELLDGLLNLLEKERMRLEDFDVKNLTADESEVRISVVTSVEGSRKLLKELPRLGASVRTTTTEQPE
jgi:putative Mg2+ transporter-C (MgtC) family protein